MQVSKPKDRLTPEYLAQIWNCGIETAKKSIEATTCNADIIGRVRMECNADSDHPAA